MKKKQQGPRVLIVDIETAPMVAHVWDLFDQNVALNQIVKDWHLLSWSAKWLNDPASKVMYMDQRNAKNIEDDKKLLEGIWKLLDQADIVLGQNSKRFDIKKLNARFVMNEMQPPSSFKQLDTLVIAKKHFAMTSNKLEYLTNKLCKKYKKLKHKKFPGHALWTECLKGNKEAWNEMERYNKHDVLATEELYKVFQGWDNTINFNLYIDDNDVTCNCGSKNFRQNGHAYTASGKFKRYKCKDCGAEMRGTNDQFSKDKKKSLRRKVT